MRRGGKYKQKRGGGRSFSRDLVVNEDGIAVAADEWRRQKNKGPSIEEESDEEEEKEEEQDEDESSDSDEEEEDGDGPKRIPVAGPSNASGSSVNESRANRKADKKQKKQGQQVDEEDKDLVNPNRLPMKNLTIADVGAPRELSRKERRGHSKLWSCCG
ncbi:hypothetical protein FRC19_011369 [Serendipita sp. 401]|nr:hypothetical protein FRC19_011369 [Serendipita sp. 401]